MNPLPLAGVRVCEFSWVWAGPYCGKLLADLGAEVIKVESSKRLDTVRGIAPFADGQPGVNRSGYFNMLNRNKLGITLDLTSDKGRGLIKELIALSDVVTENYTPRVMKGWGLDYASLTRVKPDVVMCSMGAYGQFGPESHYMGYGPTQVPMTGLASLNGFPGGPPQPSGVSYGDPVAGVTAAFAIMAALHYRRHSGKGQYIDLSQWQSTAVLLPEGLMEYIMNGRLKPRQGNEHEWMAPHNVYRCAGEDRWLGIAVANDEQWAALKRVMGNPEWTGDAKFADGLSRWHNRQELDALISRWTADKDDRALWQELQAAGVPSGPSLTSENLVNDPHLKARGFWVQDNHPEAGSKTLAGIVPRLSETPGTLHRHAPLLGQHTDQILRDLLHKSDDEIAALREEQILV